MLRIHSVTFHSVGLAGHPSPPARAAQGDSSQSLGIVGAFADWFAQSPPPTCCWDRIHRQCAPTPPKSATVRLHQIHPSPSQFGLGFRFALFVWICFSFLNELPFRFWRFLYRMVPFLNISIISLVRLASSGCSRMSSRFTQAAYFSSPLSMVILGSPSRSQ